LQLVINYDLPNIPETYVHRIGRTGRAGAGGNAVSFCDAEEKSYLHDIHRLIGKSIPVMEHPFMGTGDGKVAATMQLQEAEVIRKNQKQGTSIRTKGQNGTYSGARMKEVQSVSIPGKLEHKHTGQAAGMESSKRIIHLRRN